MEKKYKLRICFGDGKPVEAEVVAKNGIAAQDLVAKNYPGSRSVHILEVEKIIPPPPPAKPKPKKTKAINEWPKPPDDSEPSQLFTDLTIGDVKNYLARDNAHKANLLNSVIQLRRKGLSHRKIASTLGIGSTTVGSWLKQYGSD